MSAAFEIETLRTQAKKIRDNAEVTIAPSELALKEYIKIVTGWMNRNGLSPADRADAEVWLANIERLEGISEATKATARNALNGLKESIESANLSPAERLARAATKLDERTKTPEGFDEFISLYIKDEKQYSPDRRLSEFRTMFNAYIFGAGLSYQIEKNRVVIYNPDGTMDVKRTSSIGRVANVIDLVRRSRAMTTMVESGEQNPLAYINAQTKRVNLPTLTDDIIYDASKKARYISDVRNSRLSPEVKATIIEYIENPTSVAQAYADTRAQAQQVRADREEGRRICREAGVMEKFTEEDFRNPSQLLEKIIGNMGILAVPATIYLVLNLFGVSHDSLFMKLLAGTSAVAVAKGTGAWDWMIDAATGKSKTVNDAIDWTKKQWNTSNEAGVIRWMKDIVGEGVATTQENIKYFKLWEGYSNYHAIYTGDGNNRPLPVMMIPFDYVYTHIQTGAFDAKFSKDQSSLKSKGSEYADFVKLMNELNAEGIKNYGEERWKKIRANRTIAEVVTVAYRRDAVPVSERPVGSAASAAPAAGVAGAVAGAVGAGADALKGAAGSVADAATEAVDAAGKKLKPVADYVQGTETLEQKTAREAREAGQNVVKQSYEANAEKRKSKAASVLADANLVGLVQKHSPRAKIQEYIDVINSEAFQTTMSVKDIGDFLYEGTFPANIRIPENIDKVILRNVFQKYLLGNNNSLKKSEKDKFFAGSYSDKLKMLTEII